MQTKQPLPLCWLAHRQCGPGMLDYAAVSSCKRTNTRNLVTILDIPEDRHYCAVRRLGLDGVCRLAQLDRFNWQTTLWVCTKRVQRVEIRIGRLNTRTVVERARGNQNIRGGYCYPLGARAVGVYGLGANADPVWLPLAVESAALGQGQGLRGFPRSAVWRDTVLGQSVHSSRAGRSRLGRAIEAAFSISR
jgi:hypothetical protein